MPDPSFFASTITVIRFTKRSLASRNMFSGVEIYVLSIFIGAAAAGLQVKSVRDAVAYYDPHQGGGSMFDNAGYGYGEPLNVS